jgi:hypothetical protein
MGHPLPQVLQRGSQEAGHLALEKLLPNRHRANALGHSIQLRGGESALFDGGASIHDSFKTRLVL